jgi:ferredoxin
MASGACVLAAPQVFAQDEDGLVVVLQGEPHEALRAQVEAAVRACPAAVIALED